MPSRTTINFWLDTLLLVVFLGMSWVSLIIRFVFPPASQSLGWTLWGRDLEWWSSLQFATLCLFAAGILLHVMLHWSWVCGVIASWRRKRSGAAAKAKPDTGVQTLYGVGLLIAILNVLGVGIAAAVLTVQEPPL
ncbi:MAG: DUF4405 domain-containing protein [Planctomycetota bacterium]